MNNDIAFEIKNKSFSIDTLKTTDIEPLLKVIQQWVRNSETGRVFQPEIDAIKQRMENNGQQYTVVRNSEGVAIGMAGLREPEEKLKQFISKPTRELINVFLDNDLRGFGIGYTLVNACFAKAKAEGFEEVIWSSGRRYKTSSWEFYRKIAGEPIAEIDGFFGVGSYACIWKKSV